jgi:hypothetical protein
LIDHIPGGQLPRPNDLFESEIRPVAGKILELTLAIEPLGPTYPRTSYEGFYSSRQRFSLSTADIGILLKDDLYLDSVAGLMNGKAYDRVGSSQSFRDKWRTIEKTVYFCVPSDISEFRITHDKYPITQGRLTNVETAPHCPSRLPIPTYPH